MKIGLYDYDFVAAPKTHCLSVEIMQMASYYESQGHVVELLDETSDIFQFDKVFLYARKLTLGIAFKQYLSQHPNIELFGPTFTNWRDLGIDLEEITMQPILTKYYKKVLSNKVKNGQLTLENAKKLWNTKWIKLYNNKLINLETILTGDKYIIEDDDILEKDDFDYVYQHLLIYPRYYHFIYPLLIHNTTELERFNKLYEGNIKNLHGIILIDSNEEFFTFIEQNIELIKKLATRLRIALFYNSQNSYSGAYYKEALKSMITRLNWLYLKKIYVCGVEIKTYTNIYFEEYLLNTFKQYPRYKINIYNSYLRDNRDSYLRQRDLYKFLNRNPEFYHWFKIPIMEEREYGRFLVLSRRK